MARREVGEAACEIQLPPLLHSIAFVVLAVIAGTALGAVAAFLD